MAMKGGNMTLPEIAETLEGAIRILEDEAERTRTRS